MARKLIGEISQGEMLTNSVFEGDIVDQHLGFHFLLSLILPFFDKPWVALRFTQIGFLCAFFGAIFLFFWRKKSGYFLSILTCGASLGFAEALLTRFYFLRIESLVLATLAIAIYFSSYLKRPIKRFWWYALFLLGILFSWVNLILVFIPIWIYRRSFYKLVTQIVVLLSLVLVSFSLRGDIGTIFSYFNQLINFTILGDPGIREWKPTTDFLILPFFLQVAAAILVLGSRYFKIKYWHRERLWGFYFLLFFLLSIKYTRFSTLAFFMAMPILTFFLHHLFLSLKFTQTAMGRFYLIFGIFFFGYYLHSRPEVFRRWNSEVHNFYQSIQSFQKLKEVPYRVIVSHWEHWSFLSWHLPHIEFEPGLSTLIYEVKDRKSIMCLEDMRAIKSNVQLKFFVDCLRQMQFFFKTDYLLLSQQTKHARDFLKKYPFLGEIVFENSDGMLFKINSNLHFPKVVSRDISSLLIEKRNKILPPSYLIRENGLLGSFHINSPTSLWSLKDPTHLLRSIMTTWVFCRAGQLRKADCRVIFRNYKKYSNQHLNNLGIQAMMGLLAFVIQDTESILEYQQSILSDLGDAGLFHSVKYENRESIFEPGEALLFLYQSLQSNNSPSILTKVEKAFFNYWFQYKLNQNWFYVRWLSEVIAERSLFFGLRPDYEGAFLLNRLESSWVDLCPLYLAPHYDLFWSSLLLEGFVHLYKNKTSDLINRYYLCSLGSLRPYGLNPNYYFFVIHERHLVVRDDLQAHAWGGLYCAEVGSQWCF